MIKIKLTLMILFITFGMALTTNSKNMDMTGTWRLKVVTGNGQGSPQFILKQNNGLLSGRYIGTFGESDLQGKIQGNRFEIFFEAGGISITYNGQVSANQIEGKVVFGEYTKGNFTGKKL